MDNPRLRCSDADREQVAEALRQAAADGRLTLNTLEERLEATYNARTYADLAPITSDLPDGSHPVPPQLKTASEPPVTPVPGRTVPPHRMRQYLPARRSERIVTIGGHARRTTPWRAPHAIGVMALFGEVTLDFCEATVPHPRVVVDLAVVRGRVNLIVPDGVEVSTHAVRHVPNRSADTRRSRDLHGGPVYAVQGFVVLGELTVRTPTVE